MNKLMGKNDGEYSVLYIRIKTNIKNLLNEKCDDDGISVTEAIRRLSIKYISEDIVL